MPQTATTGHINGAAVEAARKARGLSQGAAATAADISQAYLSQIETGRRTNVSAARLARLAATLDVDPAELLAPAAKARPVLTVAEAAERLRLGEQTIRVMCRRREIVAARLGRQWRIPESEVSRLLTPTERAS